MVIVRKWLLLPVLFSGIGRQISTGMLTFLLHSIDPPFAGSLQFYLLTHVLQFSCAYLVQPSISYLCSLSISDNSLLFACVSRWFHSSDEYPFLLDLAILNALVFVIFIFTTLERDFVGKVPDQRNDYLPFHDEICSNRLKLSLRFHFCPNNDRTLNSNNV